LAGTPASNALVANVCFYGIIGINRIYRNIWVKTRFIEVEKILFPKKKQTKKTGKKSRCYIMTKKYKTGNGGVKPGKINMATCFYR